MAEAPLKPPLKSLHPDSALKLSKLAHIGRISTETLLESLLPGFPNCLKTRPDGTILEGHHRIHILRQEAWMWTTSRAKLSLRNSSDSLVLAQRPLERKAGAGCASARRRLAGG